VEMEVGLKVAALYVMSMRLAAPPLAQDLVVLAILEQHRTGIARCAQKIHSKQALETA